MTSPRLSWVHPEIAASVRETLRRGRASWEEVFDGAGDEVQAGEPPQGVAREVWPRLAEHVARAERVREVVAERGVRVARMRFATSPHAVERAVLMAEWDAAAPDDDEVKAIAGLLACQIDEWIPYGQFLGRLVERGVTVDPAATVSTFESFVAAASAVATEQPSWPERLRVARDGLAALYVKVGRPDDAERIYQDRFVEEPADTTIAISAARAFLEAGDTSRAVDWLGRAAVRADDVGRADLAARLAAKAAVLRARMN